MHGFISLAMVLAVMLFIVSCFIGPAFRGTVRLIGGILIGVISLLGLIVVQALLWLLILVGVGLVVLFNRLRYRRR